MLAPWKKSTTNLDSILKSRDITLPTKLHLLKAMVFPVVMYGCESWTTKKAEHQRTDAFQLWCWRRLLRVPWTARRSNESILRQNRPEYSLEGLMLKLMKLQYFGRMMRRADSLEKTLMLGKIEGGRKRGRQRMLGTLALESSFCYLNLIYGCISCIYWTGQDFLHESQFMWFTNTAYDQEKIMGRMLVIEDF